MFKKDGIIILEAIGEATEENIPGNTVYVYKHSLSKFPMWSVERAKEGVVAKVFRFDDAIKIAKLFQKENEAKREMTSEEKYKDASITG